MLHKKNKELVFLTTPDQAGKRLDVALKDVEEIQSRSRALYLIEKNLVLVNGTSKKASYILKTHDEISISLPITEEDGKLISLDAHLHIVFQDEDIVVINKPSGLVVHPALGHAQDTLVNILIAKVPDLLMKFSNQRPGIVHRLDKDTSGLMVVAKNDFSQEQLMKQFKSRSIFRIYQALSCGPKPLKHQGIIESYLARHTKDRKKFASLPNSLLHHDGKDKKPRATPPSGKYAKTFWQLADYHSDGVCLFQLRLATGRTHQIRVHLSEWGYPILGDPIYNTKAKLGRATSTQTKSLLAKVPHLALHARALGFNHPRSGEKLFFTVDWPDEMSFIFSDLKLSTKLFLHEINDHE